MKPFRPLKKGKGGKLEFQDSGSGGDGGSAGIPGEESGSKSGSGSLRIGEEKEESGSGSGLADFWEDVRKQQLEEQERRFSGTQEPPRSGHSSFDFPLLKIVTDIIVHLGGAAGGKDVNRPSGLPPGSGLGKFGLSLLKKGRGGSGGSGGKATALNADQVSTYACSMYPASRQMGFDWNLYVSHRLPVWPGEVPPP